MSRPVPARATERMREDAPMKQVAIVANPAKVDDVAALAGAVAERLAARGWPEPIVFTTTEQDPGRGATEQALQQGAEVVLAAGGDGTVAAVLSALSGTSAALAVLPSGTGNLLVRNLDLPTRVEDVVAAVLDAPARRIDLGEVVTGPGAGSSFALMAGLGFDAALVGDAPEGLKARLGWPAYLVSALSHLGDEPFECTVRLDGGEPVTRTVRTVLVANAAGLPGGVDLAPGSGSTDGLLDVIVVSPQNVLDWMRVTTRLAIGSDREDDRLERFQVRRVEITTATEQVCQLDGDPVGRTTHLAVEVRPLALRVHGAAPDEDQPGAGPTG